MSISITKWTSLPKLLICTNVHAHIHASHMYNYSPRAPKEDWGAIQSTGELVFTEINFYPPGFSQTWLWRLQTRLAKQGPCIETVNSNWWLSSVRYQWKGMEHLRTSSHLNLNTKIQKSRDTIGCYFSGIKSRERPQTRGSNTATMLKSCCPHPLTTCQTSCLSTWGFILT